MAYCFDCECQTGGASLCRSCRNHRADGHPPTRYEHANHDPVTGESHTLRWYCHGAGPSGVTGSRLGQPVRALQRSELSTRPDELAVAV